MSRSRDETRRAFLKRLARTAAFVPPAVASVSVRRAAAQGKGGTSGGGPGGGQPNAVTGLSPASSTQSIQMLPLQESQTAEPWSGPTQEPPWSRPPPTQTGR